MKGLKVNNVMPCNPSSARRQFGSGPNDVKCVTGRAEVNDPALHGQSATGRILKTDQLRKGESIATDQLRKGESIATDQLRKGESIATWNVRGLLQTGKLHIVEQELRKHQIDICGLSETHWKGCGHFETNDYVIYIAGANDTGRNGVAFLVNKRTARYVEAYRPVNERILTLTLNTKPYKLHLVQVYLPTTATDDQEIEEIYANIEDTIKDLKPRGITIILGDFNAKVGNTSMDNHLRENVGQYGLGVRNERGNRLLQFATDNNFSIMNTMFKHHKRRLFTWTSPSEQYKNQIDYILVDKRWRTSFRNVKTKPGAECGSDHRLLWAYFKIKLSKPVAKMKSKRLTIPEPTAFQEALRSTGPPDIEGNSDIAWMRIEKWILDATGKIPKINSTVKRQHWMTNETLALIETRLNIRFTVTNPEEREQLMKKINNDIKHACRRDKNDHIKRLCAELEAHATEKHSAELYDRVKYLAREFMPRTQIIKNNQGITITDAKGITEVWRKYCIKLFSDDPQSMPGHQNTTDVEPAILREEVEHAMKKLRNRRAPGQDGITAEILKSMGDVGIDILHKLCQKIWTSGNWPKQWCHSTFIPLLKKGSPLDCANYRTIALIPHASKIMLTILNERLRAFLLPQIPDEQTGFVPGKGTREQILNIRQLIEKAREYNVKMFMCFVDYKKAFDKVKWSKLWTILIEMGTPKHLVYLIQQLYISNTATVRVNNTLSDVFSTNAGVRQGCILSPLLFNVYSEYIMREVFEGWNDGTTVGGRKINNLRYADDTLIIATDEHRLETIMRRLADRSREYGLEINNTKTKVMIIDRPNNNRPDITRIAGYEVVRRFDYLGSIVTDTGDCEPEIRKRIAIARNSTAKLTRIWKDTSITARTKLTLVRTLVFPIATYAAETWTMKMKDRSRIDALEMWCYRRLLRIPWTALRTNESILWQLGIKTRLSTLISQKQLTYFGHIARRPEAMERLIIEGKAGGRRSRGRPPSRWVDQIKCLTGLPLQQASHHAQDRALWRQIAKRPAT